MLWGDISQNHTKEIQLSIDLLRASLSRKFHINKQDRMLLFVYAIQGHLFYFVAVDTRKLAHRGGPTHTCWLTTHICHWIPSVRWFGWQGKSFTFVPCSNWMLKFLAYLTSFNDAGDAVIVTRTAQPSMVSLLWNYPDTWMLWKAAHWQQSHPCQTLKHSESRGPGLQQKTFKTRGSFRCLMF